MLVENSQRFDIKSFPDSKIDFANLVVAVLLFWESRTVKLTFVGLILKSFSESLILRLILSSRLILRLVSRRIDIVYQNCSFQLSTVLSRLFL